MEDQDNHPGIEGESAEGSEESDRPRGFWGCLVMAWAFLSAVGGVAKRCDVPRAVRRSGDTAVEHRQKAPDAGPGTISNPAVESSSEVWDAEASQRTAELLAEIEQDRREREARRQEREARRARRASPTTPGTSEVAP